MFAHCCRHLTLVTLFAFVVALFIFLSAHYWPALSNLFVDHRLPTLEPDREGPGHASCYFIENSNDYILERENPPRRRTSLLARPLKHISNSLSVRELTLARMHSLIKHDYQTATDTGTYACTNRTFWRLHRNESIQDRLNRLDCFCNAYDFTGRIFTYRPSTSNRQYGSSEEPFSKYCSTKTCPMLVDEQHQVLTCFVQKIASTSLKQIFLQLTQFDSTHNQSTLPESVNNLTSFHLIANEKLFRISPVYFRHSKESHYFKSLFVRHPFVRLVSAFKDKAERGPEHELYFYTQYWNPLFDQIYGPSKWNASTRITFRQFVDKILLKTEPYLYDEHWAPIWTRCEPCFMQYDFIGKLESSEADFYHFKSQVDPALVNVTIWENRNRHFGANDQVNLEEKQCQNEWSKIADTRRYLEQLTPEIIIELYKRYYLDFELFGYSLEELFF